MAISLTSIDPIVQDIRDALRSITIYGTNLDLTYVVSFRNQETGGTSATMFNTYSSSQGVLDNFNLPVGYYDVWVTGAGGVQSNTLYYSVIKSEIPTEPPEVVPEITSVEPSKVYKEDIPIDSELPVEITVTGTNLSLVNKLVLFNSTTIINSDGIILKSDTSITATYRINATVSVGELNFGDYDNVQLYMKRIYGGVVTVFETRADDPGIPTEAPTPAPVTVDLSEITAELSSIRTAISSTPDYSNSFTSIHTAISELPDYTEALGSLQSAISSQTDYSDALANVQTAISELPDYSDAVASVQQAIAEQPSYSEDLKGIKTEVSNLNITIKTETNPILERMAVALETIAVKHSSIEQHVAKLRELGEGDGIHWVRPHDWKGGKSSFDTTLTDAAGVAIKSTIDMENKQ